MTEILRYLIEAIFIPFSGGQRAKLSFLPQSDTKFTIMHFFDVTFVSQFQKNRNQETAHFSVPTLFPNFIVFFTGYVT